MTHWGTCRVGFPEEGLQWERSCQAVRQGKGAVADGAGCAAAQGQKKAHRQGTEFTPQVRADV